jgi:hypothetical protein
MPPIDRSPVGRYGLEQTEILDTNTAEVSPERLQFIIDHGSALLSDGYYTYLMRRSAETMRHFVCNDALVYIKTVRKHESQL